jgi:hypothetical protein
MNQTKEQVSSQRAEPTLDLESLSSARGPASDHSPPRVQTWTRKVWFGLLVIGVLIFSAISGEFGRVVGRELASSSKPGKPSTDDLVDKTVTAIQKMAPRKIEEGVTLVGARKGAQDTLIYLYTIDTTLIIDRSKFRTMQSAMLQKSYCEGMRPFIDANIGVRWDYAYRDEVYSFIFRPNDCR